LWFAFFEFISGGIFEYIIFWGSPNNTQQRISNKNEPTPQND
jgi:hypothetical protein